MNDYPQTEGPKPQTGEVEVLSVGDPANDREWKSQKGAKYISYRVKLRLPDGMEISNVEVNTKADSPKKLTVGEKAFGEFDPRPGNPHGPRFFKKGGAGGGGGGFRGRSPLEGARIQRQHSQEMAIRVASAAGWFNDLADNSENIAGLLNGPVKKLTDYFDQDIDRGGIAALERRKADGIPNE